MKSLKNKLEKNELTLGSWITISHTSIPEIMAKFGFDWLTIDLEHSAISLDKAFNLIQVIDLLGISPIVRVGENNQYLIKRVLDAGAHGAIIPMVNSREDAEKAVEAVKYPPKGKRGIGLARAQGYGQSFETYKKWLDKESVIIVQIEHIKAVENLESILSVEGIDGSIIGPYDLSGSIGYPGKFTRKEVIDAIKEYETICKKMNKPMGFHVVPTDSKLVNSYIKKGYKFIAVGVDFLFLGNKCKDTMEEIRG